VPSVIFGGVVTLVVIAVVAMRSRPLQELGEM